MPSPAPASCSSIFIFSGLAVRLKKEVAAASVGHFFFPPSFMGGRIPRASSCYTFASDWTPLHKFIWHEARKRAKNKKKKKSFPALLILFSFYFLSLPFDFPPLRIEKRVRGWWAASLPREKKLRGRKYKKKKAIPHACTLNVFLFFFSFF